MQRVLSALFTPDVLGLILLAVVGVFVFMLVRPREQDAREEFWLAFMQQRLGNGNSVPRSGSKPETPKA